jgi:hypothetical protein
MFGYNFRSLEADALVGAFTEGEIAQGAGANSFAHQVRAGYVFADGISVSTILSQAKRDMNQGAGAKTANRYQLDLSFWF